MEDIIHLWDGEKWNGPITDGHLHLDRKGRFECSTRFRKFRRY